jgi:hypothetical protein
VERTVLGSKRGKKANRKLGMPGTRKQAISRRLLQATKVPTRDLHYQQVLADFMHLKNYPREWL